MIWGQTYFTFKGKHDDLPSDVQKMLTESKKEAVSSIISKSEGIVFIDADLEYPDGLKDQCCMIYSKGKLIMFTSNHEVAGVKSEGKGVSVIMDPGAEDPRMKPLQKRALKTIEDGRLSVIVSESYLKLLRNLRTYVQQRDDRPHMLTFFQGLAAGPLLEMLRR